MSDIQENPIERAKRLGTFRQIDRTKQYEGRYSSEMLLRSDNHLWARMRQMEKDKFRRSLIVVAVSAAAARLPEVFHFVARLLK